MPVQSSRSVPPARRRDWMEKRGLLDATDNDIICEEHPEIENTASEILDGRPKYAIDELDTIKASRYSVDYSRAKQRSELALQLQTARTIFYPEFHIPYSLVLDWYWTALKNRWATPADIQNQQRFTSNVNPVEWEPANGVITLLSNTDLILADLAVFDIICDSNVDVSSGNCWPHIDPADDDGLPKQLDMRPDGFWGFGANRFSAGVLPKLKKISGDILQFGENGVWAASVCWEYRRLDKEGDLDTLAKRDGTITCMKWVSHYEQLEEKTGISYFPKPTTPTGEGTVFDNTSHTFMITLVGCKVYFWMHFSVITYRRTNPEDNNSSLTLTRVYGWKKFDGIENTKSSHVQTCRHSWLRLMFWQNFTRSQELEHSVLAANI